MKAIRVHAPGGPDALRYEDIERPAPGPGQVLVKIEAAGVNFIDIYQRTGHYKIPLPVTLGQEAAGSVSAVGPGVAAPKVGERVAYASLLGAYAEYAGVPADRVVVLPGGASTTRGGAGLPRGPSAHCLAPRGMMVLYGQSSGPVGPFDPQVLSQKGSLFLTRPTLAHYIATRAELLARAGELLGWSKSGKLTVRIERELPLAQAAEAHRLLEGRKTTGKVLLIP